MTLKFERQGRVMTCQMKGCANEGIARPVYDANPVKELRKQIGTVYICEADQQAIDKLNSKAGRFIREAIKLKEQQRITRSRA